ncbi:MAG: exodeoxyribonuclease V subunit gamma [Actinomycetales bacterium]|nr:MAG: exodeoxyribonuclease V subunit gamma [Actinomycetales bacterium]
MGLFVHRADRTDLLADGLARLLAAPPDDPFAADLVAVPAKGIERWLSQRLSHRLGARTGHDDGVCAAVHFRTPWSLLAEVIGTGDDDPWAPAVLTWPVLAEIDAAVAAEAPWAAPLLAHLGAPDDELRRGRRWALARRVTGLFSSYAAQRPTVLMDWEAGRDTDGLGAPVPGDLAWQPRLWRAVLAAVGAPAPAARHTEVLRALATHPGAFALPARLSLFGHTRLSVSDVEILGALATHRDVHVWLPHPSATMWRALAEGGCDRPVRRRDDHSHLLVEHPLLVGLGRDVRELQRTVGALDGHTATTFERGDPDADQSTPTTLLGHLQADLRTDRRPDDTTRQGRRLRPTDRSVRVHACHGPTRQVEVLREELLGLLDDEPDLQPRDILIMCPDIETYAPLFTAEFGLGEVLGGQAHPAHRLRVQLADRALHQTNPLLGVVERLLDLAGGRAEASAVLDLAHTAPVRRRFGFDDDDLEQFTRWVRETGVRWGFDAAHRADFGLDGVIQNTWRQGLDRLLAGVAMSDDTGTWLDTTLPLDDVGSSRVELVGRIAEFVDRLRDATDALVGMHPAAHWVATLDEGLTSLTDVPPHEHWQLGQAQRELAAIGDAAEADAQTGPMLRLPDVRALLTDRLAGRPTRASFRTGTLTVCTMVPMRSVPHRVVALVGLDDGVFPRQGLGDGDDLLARDPVTGERDSRSEDRQLLLDAILAATDTLVVTYTGADPHTGARRPPAAPLGELLDALDATATADARRVSEVITVHHPLQSFDPRNLTPGALLPDRSFSFDPSALTAARAGQGPRRLPPAFVEHRLPGIDTHEVSLADLIDFVRNPIRHFLRARLDLTLLRDEPPVSDAVPLALDGLLEWSVGDRVLTDLLAGLSPDTARQREWRRATLPPGQLGWAALHSICERAEAPAAHAMTQRGEADARAVDVDLDIGAGRRLTGTVTGVYTDRLVPVSYSRLSVAERLTSWVRVLALAATHPGTRWSAHTVGRGTRRSALVAFADVGPPDPDHARAVLCDLVALRDLGLREPLPLPPKTTAVYAAARHRGSREASARSAARNTWSGKYPERDDPAYRLVWGNPPWLPGLDQVDDTDGDGEPAPPDGFAALAMRLWAPLLQVETVGEA